MFLDSKYIFIDSNDIILYSEFHILKFSNSQKLKHPITHNLLASQSFYWFNSTCSVSRNKSCNYAGNDQTYKCRDN